MDNHQIKAIIFDLGNVLVDFNHMLAAEKVSQSSDYAPQEIYNLFFDSDLTAIFEEGKISAKEFFQKVKEKLNLKLGYAEFVPIWNEVFFLSPKNHSVYNLANSLKEKYKIAVLSNVNILHFEYIKEKFPVFGIFPNVITSFELGVRKPHPLIYRKTLELLNVSPAEAFYTDDRSELVRGAKELGIQGFVFRDIAQLEKDLINSGINIKF